jgi:hypothetical protein
VRGRARNAAKRQGQQPPNPMQLECDQRKTFVAEAFSYE